MKLLEQSNWYLYILSCSSWLIEIEIISMMNILDENINFASNH